MSAQSHDCEPSSSSSSISDMSPPILPWGDLERNFASLQISIEARLKDLEIKEARMNERLRELDSREAKIRSHSDPNFSGTTDAKKLLFVLSESASEHETLCERVRRALWDSGDPGKVVLEAIGDLYGEDSEKRKGVVLILEQLAEIGPSIGPTERAEAARLAREWRARILEEDFNGRSGVSEVLGFLLLIGAFDLVDEFDSGDVFGVFRCIRRPSFRSTGGDCNADFGWGDNDEQDSPASTISNPQEEDCDKDSPASPAPNPRKRRGPKRKEQSLEEDLELVNQIASAFTSTFEALQSFCGGMDGRKLKLFLYQYVEEHDSWGSEVREALTYAPDPAKLVLDSIPGFLRTQPEFHKSLTMAKVRKSCILLLEQLISIFPPISQSVGGEALKLAKEWGSSLGQVYQRPVIVYGFLLLLAAYRLGSTYDREELLRLLGIASQYKAYPGLCRALGFADEVLIESLVKKMMLLEAVDNVCACGLVSKFQPVRLLKDYLKFSRKRIYKKGDQSSLQQEQAINKEITAIKTVIKYIAKYKLESTYPPGGLEKQILQLEIKKGKITDSAEFRKPHTDLKSSTAPSSSVPCVSNTVDSKPKVEPLVKEESPSDDQPVQPEQDGRAEMEGKPLTAVSSVPSNSPWPLLESFCINLYGEGFNILSHKIKEEEKKESNSMVSSSSFPASLWPELKHLCMNMDGEGLRTFVYNHIDKEKNESLRSEIMNALNDASYPAKLVLDAMPGCLRTQPEFDKTLNINKVRNTRILLLEELITISPLIGPLVRENAAKMANDWRGNLGFKYKAPDNVFGFLHFVAAYGIVSDFEADELLGLLGHANQHRVCPGLCRILGFADKASVVIDNLVQMNLVVEAVEHIFAFEVENYSPPLLLKEYVNSIKVRFDGIKPPAKKVIEQEIAALRSVIDCVAKYKLESELPPRHIMTRIVKLEKKKLAVLDPKKVTPLPNVRA